MSRNEHEEEQIEAIKSWWKKNGTALLTVVLVVVATFSGWRYWQNSQYVSAANASATFEVLQSKYQQGSFGDVAREALKLMNENPDSAYASAAAMLHAKFSFEKGDFEEAQKNLQWVTEHSNSIELKATAQLRMARLLAQSGDYDQAQKTLSAISLPKGQAQEQSALSADIEYVKGLIALSQNDSEQAFMSFQSVMDNPNTDDNLKGLAEIQLADLAK